jgi:hypothetical protein
MLVEGGMEPLPEYLQPLEKATPPFPRESVEEAIRRWDESAPWFLAGLKEAAERSGTPDPGNLFHEFALRLLAQFRDARAYESAVQLTRRPDVDDFLGDSITEDLGRILASVSGGDPRLLQELVADQAADEFARGAGLTALGVLCRQGQVSREDFSKYLGSLLAGGLEKEAGFLWTDVADICATFGFSEHEPALKEAWDAGLIDPFFDDWKNLRARLRSGVFDKKGEKHYSYFEDAAASMEDWGCFDAREVFEEEDEDAIDHEERPADVPIWDDELAELGEVPGPVRAAPKIGRNDPCPCGSGKKYKKCCGK